jgi:putative oxidoreductase
MNTISQLIPLKYNRLICTITIYLNFGIFFYSGIDKTIHFEEFVNSFSKSQFAPQNYVALLSAIIVILEIGLSLLLFVEKARKLALIGFGFLSLAFSIYISLMKFYSPYLPCSCGGIIDLLSWNEHLILTISLFLLSFYSAKVQKP